MTGRFAQHVNMHNLALTVPRHGIPVEMTTIASKLKSVGCELILASMLHFSSSHVQSPSYPCVVWNLSFCNSCWP